MIVRNKNLGSPSFFNRRKNPGKSPQKKNRLKKAASHPPLVCHRYSGPNASENHGTK